MALVEHCKIRLTALVCSCVSCYCHCINQWSPVWPGPVSLFRASICNADIALYTRKMDLWLFSTQLRMYLCSSSRQLLKLRYMTIVVMTFISTESHFNTIIHLSLASPSFSLVSVSCCLMAASSLFMAKVLSSTSARVTWPWISLGGDKSEYSCRYWLVL